MAPCRVSLVHAVNGRFRAHALAVVQGLQEELVDMKGERVAYEEELERKRRENRCALISGFMQTRASRCIQRYWAAYLQAKKKAAKEASKGKGKGK